MEKFRSYRRPNLMGRQGGATIVVFITILFLVMMLSMHIQDGSNDHQKFTYQLKHKSTAEANAQIAMRYAQSLLKEQNQWSPFELGASGDDDKKVWESSNVNIAVDANETWWDSESHTDAADPDNGINNQFVIEQLLEEFTGNLVDQPNGNYKEKTHSYRITARGTSQEPGVEARLQGTFIRTFWHLE